MIKRKSSGRSLLLVEIGVLFIFFLISIVICVSIFISASNRNSNANDLNNATTKAITIADTIKACDGDMKEAGDLLDADSDLNIYYNSNWEKDGSKVYKASISYQIEDGMLSASIEFTNLNKSELIYSLDIKEYLQGDMP